MGPVLDQLKTAGPVLLAIASTIYGMLRSGRKSARLRHDLKENLELAKLATEADAEDAQARLRELVSAQATALAVLEDTKAGRTRDTQSLVTVLVLVVLGGAIMAFCWWMDSVVTDVLLWLVVAFLALFVPVGLVSWWRGGTADGSEVHARGSEEE
ncbi:hypothetical protein Acsp06_09070 [Actinomycetospora sp. NBRC 106375]|uniref:hypothetical protein n=1 Tax=Actinomycetospora sp. NBRC 106375 TaxID=3032207 RepID=UPI0024A3129E|nr:hypothetical protein [Actinomycetospora sp. NBRC 106375]GLZ44722.1 hypothetical protein Acsp06_09070 [Actinomycetospora sp. NBRC 106375]